MKKSIIITAVSLACMTFASCDHLLNENRFPLDKQTDNPAYWDNEANVAKQCDDLYRNYTGYGDSGYGLFYFETLTDNQGSGVGGAFTNWAYTNVPTASSLWSASYEVIRHCNQIIINVEKSGKLNENTKKKYIGIARMNRAMQYYELVRAYGDVPYTDQILDVNSPELYGPRTDRDVVMDKVYEDLAYAAENIGNGTKTTWSSDMALAMMSKICLYEGAYCKYRTVEENYKAADPARANKFFGYVVEAGDKLMAKGYSLNSDYRANYNSVSLQGNPEMIFYKAYKESTLTHQTIRYTVASTVIAGISKDAFDDFLFVDGKPKALTSENTDDAGVVKTGIVDGVSKLGQVLSITNVLATRDKRLSAIVDTVVCYGSSETGMTYSRAGSSQLSSSTGYLVRKFDNTSIPVNFRTGNNYTCAPVFWLSVIYCDYAEAKAELGTLTDTDLDNTLNKLFARAGLPAQTVAGMSNMNDPANDMNISSLLWEVRRCRRCETMLDDDLRYWDLQRWHQLDKLDTKLNPDIKLGANLKNAVKEYGYMSGDYMQSIPNNDRVYSKREYLYPIPSEQITLNDQLIQNVNWK